MPSIKRYMPILQTFDDYDGSKLRGDLQAGLTTAVMLIPQGMGYALLAGLPPIYGLYSSLVPLLIYAVFGTSRQLAVGPVAMVSLLVAAGVGTIAEPGSANYVAYAIMLALMVGALQLSMGVLRLGFLVNFLSHPVISGFTSAAALIIGFSQLKHLMGFNIPRSHHIHEILGNAFAGIEATHIATLVIGVASIAALVLLKKYAPRFPRALAVVVVGSLAVWLFGLNEGGVSIVGSVPDGLPALSLPTFDWASAREMFPIALTISLVSFMESIAVAKKYATLNKYQVDANQELIGLGVANIGGSFTNSYPVTGGFSRTAVNAQAGAVTNVSGLITAALIGLTLLFMTPLFYYLPKAVLAAIIMSAVFGLVDVHEVKHLWKVKRTDLAMLGLTFFATLSLGIEQGILIGVAASLGILIFNSTRPHVAVLGELPDSHIYRNVDRFEEATPVPGILALRVDSQFYFGNVNFFKETLEGLEAKRSGPLHTVVLNASGMNQIDASGVLALREVWEDYSQRGINFILTDLKGPVRDVLERDGFIEVLGKDRVFLSMEQAMEALAANRVPTVAAAA